MNENNSIKKTASQFEASFREGAYYNSQTRDNKHLALILKQLNPSPGQKILDLGTGSGYPAFPLAKKNPACRITGLDITPKTILRNNSLAEEKGLENLKFIKYEGITFPFEDRYFDIIVTRYALHHFPDIHKCFREFSRVLKPGGRLFISDPAPHKEDRDGFIDRYMRMKDDGHIQFYTPDQYRELGRKAGLVYESHVMTKIRFPRKEATKYAGLLKSADAGLPKAYCIEVTGDEIFITEDVVNISFMKAGTA